MFFVFRTILWWTLILLAKKPKTLPISSFRTARMAPPALMKTTNNPQFRSFLVWLRPSVCGFEVGSSWYSFRFVPMTEWAWASAGERCRTTLQAWRKCGDYQPLEGTLINNVSCSSSSLSFLPVAYRLSWLVYIGGVIWLMLLLSGKTEDSVCCYENFPSILHFVQVLIFLK